MTLEALLESIEQRSELFVGRRDLFALRHFLAGYVFAMHEMDSEYNDFLFGEFTAFLADKYSDKRDIDWATLIVAHEMDSDPLDVFFRLLKEYHAQK